MPAMTLDVAVMLADGGKAISDLAVLRSRRRLGGPVNDYHPAA